MLRALQKEMKNDPNNLGQKSIDLSIISENTNNITKYAHNIINSNYSRH